MMLDLNRHQGQALVEFSVMSVITAIAFWGVYLLLKGHWQRAHCTHWLFEKAHQGREGRIPLGFSQGVQLTDEGDRIRGVGMGQCSGVRDGVELPKLEHAQW